MARTVCPAYGKKTKFGFTEAEAETEAARSGSGYYHCPTCETLGYSPRTWHVGVGGTPRLGN